jgi:hypothetical protein
MDQALLNLVNGIPIAAAVLYIWRISDSNHMAEIAKWRETIEKKDQVLKEMQTSISDLTTEIKKLLFITETHVIRNRKNPTGRQNQRTQERP